MKKPGNVLPLDKSTVYEPNGRTKKIDPDKVATNCKVCGELKLGKDLNKDGVCKEHGEKVE